MSHQGSLGSGDAMMDADPALAGADRARPDWRQPPGSTWRLTAVSGLALAALLSAPILRHELASARFEASAAQNLGGAPPLPWENDDGAPCGADCPARASAAIAVRLSTDAEREPDAARRQAMLAEAKRRLGAALKVRRAAGDWWTWLAYARSLNGDDERDVLDALAQSYAAAPFLPDQGPWRARMCAVNWSSLSPAVKARVIDETIWLRDIDPVNANLLMAAFTDPDAKTALDAALTRPPAKLVPHRRSGSPSGIGTVS